MRRARIDSLATGTRVMWGGSWWEVGERSGDEVLLVHEQYRHLIAWIDADQRVSVTLASQESAP